MTIDSSPSAAGAIPASPVEPARRSEDTGHEDGDLGALADLLADTSAVSSEQAGSPSLAAPPSPGEEDDERPTPTGGSKPSDTSADSASAFRTERPAVAVASDTNGGQPTQAGVETAGPPFAVPDTDGLQPPSLLARIVDAPAVSSEEHEALEPANGTPLEDELFPAPVDAPIDAAASSDGTQPDDDEPPILLPDLSGTAVAAPAGDYDDALLRGIAQGPSISSDQVGAPGSGPDLIHGDAGEVEAADGPGAGVDDVIFESRGTESDASAKPTDADFEDMPLEAIHAGPSAALAFATDPDTEVALRDGLLGFESAVPDYGEPQVWLGGLRAAIAALRDGQSAPLIFVDIDGIPYPAGAIYELAAVCEVGTVVVAVGSDASARPGRELLLAGVSDYLAKPLTAEAVRLVAARSAPSVADSRSGGCVAAFLGSGGCGTSTLAAAAAVHAAARGCYVSVLDLHRSVPAAALALGVEPAAGLDQLLETAGRASPEPEMVEGVCARRSDRIEVYAHRWNPTMLLAPSPEAVDTLLAALRLRSQLVLVDGFDEPAMRFSPLAEVDTRVLVAEPIPGSAAHAARMMDMLGSETPLVFVLNHTRASGRTKGERALRDLGIESEPDIAIPYESELPRAADRGWPEARLPRSLRKPMTALTDRLLGSLHGTEASSSLHPVRGSWR